MALQNAVQPLSIVQLPMRTFEEQNPTVLVYKMLVTAVVGWEIIVVLYILHIWPFKSYFYN